MKLSMVVAHDCNLLIGIGPNIPWHTSEERAKLGNTIAKDFAHFKQLTVGKMVLTGGTTYKAIGKPLPNRYNIVVSRTLPLETIEPTKGIVVRSIEQGIQVAKNASTEELFVLGGGQIYSALIDQADHIYRTILIKAYPLPRHVSELDQDEAVYFPATNHADWKVTAIDRFDYAICEKATRITSLSAV